MDHEDDALFDYEPFPEWEPELEDETIIAADYEWLAEASGWEAAEWGDVEDLDEVWQDEIPPHPAPVYRPAVRRRYVAERPSPPPARRPAPQRSGWAVTSGSHYPPAPRRASFDLLTVGVALVVIFIAAGLLLGLGRTAVAGAAAEAEWAPGAGGTLLPTPTAVPAPLVLPYAGEFFLTQGIHGQSYGHMAIDLSAGAGAPLQSPLTGKVTDFYHDHLGNTVLVLENDQYRVTLLHGEYIVRLGQSVRQGDLIGYESNIGYTTDMAGNRCFTDDCGHHTHLNVYDKTLGININPLAMFALTPP